MSPSVSTPTYPCARPDSHCYFSSTLFKQDATKDKNKTKAISGSFAIMPEDRTRRSSKVLFLLSLVMCAVWLSFWLAGDSAMALVRLLLPSSHHLVTCKSIQEQLILQQAAMSLASDQPEALSPSHDHPKSYGGVQAPVSERRMVMAVQPPGGTMTEYSSTAPSIDMLTTTESRELPGNNSLIEQESTNSEENETKERCQRLHKTHQVVSM